jgi:hypothetical protein
MNSAKHLDEDKIPYLNNENKKCLNEKRIYNNC